MTKVAKIWREAKKGYQYLGRKGKVESLTKIIQAPVGFERQIPYWVGIISFRGGKKVAGQLVDGEKMKIGSKVIGVLRRIKTVDEEEVIEYGVKFKKLMTKELKE